MLFLTRVALQHDVISFPRVEAVPHVFDFGIDDPARRLRPDMALDHAVAVLRHRQSIGFRRRIAHVCDAALGNVDLRATPANDEWPEIPSVS